MSEILLEPAIAVASEQTEQERIESIELHEHLVVEAFLQAHLSDEPDLLTLQRKAQLQNPKLTKPQVSTKTFGIPLLTSIAVGSIVPVVPLAAIKARGLQKNWRTIKQKTHDIETQYEQGIVASATYLGETLGGLSCLLWRDEATGKLAVEVGEGGNTEENIAIVERLRFLERSLLKTGNGARLEGFIVPAKTAQDANIDTAPEPYNKVLTRLHAGRTVEAPYAKERVFNKTLGLDAQDMLAQTTQGLLELLKTYDPQHPIFRIHSSEMSQKTIRLLAQQSLEERLCEVRRKHAGGRKEATRVMVSDNLILSYHGNDSPTVVPLSTLALDAERLPTMSKDAALGALEFALYRLGTAPQPLPSSRAALVAPIEKQARIGIDLYNLHTSTLHAGSSDEPKEKEYETITQPTASKQELKRRANRSLLATSALALASIHLMSVTDTASDTPVLSAHSPAHPLEITAVHALHEGFDIIDDRLPDLGETADDNRSLLEQIREQIKDMRSIDTSDMSAGIRSKHNRPLWFIHAPEGVNPAGYWGEERYDALLQNDSGNYAWSSESPVERIQRITGTTGEMIAPLLTSEYAESPYYNGNEPIHVEASVAFDERNTFTFENGETYQAIRVPMLHGHSLVAGNITIWQDDTTHGGLEVRYWQDDGGTVLFVRLPDNFVPPSYDNPNGYMEVRYDVSSTPSAFRQAAMHSSGHIDFAAHSDTSLIQNILQPADLSRLRYELDPIKGDDTNNDGAYTFTDLATETVTRGTANCFTANSLYVGMTDGGVAPVKGYLLSEADVVHDLSQNEGNTIVLAQRDSHLYTVDANGSIIDMTPSNADEDTMDYLEHQKLEKGNGSPSLVVNAADTLELQSAKAEAVAGKMSLAMFGGLGALILAYGAGAVAIGLRKRSDKKLLDAATPLNIRASQLAMLAGFKLDGNTGARIGRHELAANKTFADTKYLAMLDPKRVRHALAADRKAENYRYAYTLTEAKRAERIVRAAQKKHHAAR